jgi:hypothetical protein
METSIGRSNAQRFNTPRPKTRKARRNKRYSMLALIAKLGQGNPTGKHYGSKSFKGLAERRARHKLAKRNRQHGIKTRTRTR